MTIKELLTKLSKFKTNQMIQVCGADDDGGQAALNIANVDFVEQTNTVMIFTERD